MEDGPSQGLVGRIRSLYRRLTNGPNNDSLEDEIKGIIDQGAERGIISKGEGEMIQGIFELGETAAREIMVPRTSMVSASAETSIEEVINMILSSGHTRIPIYEGDIDHIVGILHAKDLLGYWSLTPQEKLPGSIIRPPIFVPETKKILELLGEVRAMKSHMAIILDEYGGTTGLVTLEDIIEEIVGEIFDEYDVEEEQITKIDEDAYLVDAHMNLEDLEDFLGLEFPEGDYETLAGFISDLTGRVPQEEEQVEYLDLLLTIRSADERKINQVEIRRPRPAAETGPDPA